MDVLLADQWLNELEMEDSNLIRQCQVEYAGDHLLDGFSLINRLTPEVYSSFASLDDDDSSRVEQSHIEGEGAVTLSEYLLIPETVTREESVGLTQSGQGNGGPSCIGKASEEDVNESCKRSRRARAATSRAPSQAREHILAERKRREKLNQKLICLSALIPGLKKMDKASILEDAVKHIKQLNERVQTLEQEGKKKMLEPSTVAPVDEDIDGDHSHLSPEIQVRFSEKNVLVRIHCQKQQNVPTTIFSKLQALHLNVTSSMVLPFGDAALDITIIAQMDEEFGMAPKELVKNLRSTVPKLV